MADKDKDEITTVGGVKVTPCRVGLDEVVGHLHHDGGGTVHYVPVKPFHSQLSSWEMGIARLSHWAESQEDDKK